MLQDKRPITILHDVSIWISTRMHPGLPIFLLMTTSLIMSPTGCLAQLFPWFTTVGVAVAVTECGILTLPKADDGRHLPTTTLQLYSYYNSHHNILLHIHYYQTTKKRIINDDWEYLPFAKNGAAHHSPYTSWQVLASWCRILLDLPPTEQISYLDNKILA